MNVPASTPNANTQTASKTLWHRLVGKLLELLLTPLGIIVLVDVALMSDPPKADILILRRTGPQWTPEQLRYLPDGIRDSIASDVILEWKFRETVDQNAFRQAIGYDFFYQSTQKLQDEALQTFVVSAQTTHKETLEKFGYTIQVMPGVYRSTYPVFDRIGLILLNELRDEPHNAFFKVFATRQKERTSAFRLLRTTSWQSLSQKVWQFLWGLRKTYALKGDNMMDETLTADLLMEMGEEFREQILASATPEERLAGLAAEDRLAGLAAEDRLAGLTLEERLLGLDDEDLHWLIERNDQMRKQAIASAPLAERLEGLAPEERLIGLAPEDYAILLKQIERYLDERKLDKR